MEAARGSSTQQAQQYQEMIGLGLRQKAWAKSASTRPETYTSSSAMITTSTTASLQTTEPHGRHPPRSTRAPPAQQSCPGASPVERANWTWSGTEPPTTTLALRPTTIPQAQYGTSSSPRTSKQQPQVANSPRPPQHQ